MIGGGAAPSAAGGAVGPVVEAIEKIRKDREARRRSAQHRKSERVGEDGDERSAAPALSREAVDFQRMIRAYREESARTAQPFVPVGGEGASSSISVVVRKRPINARELASGDYDAVSILNPRAIVHAPKKKVDGLTRYLENTAFQFDYAFDEYSDTTAVYAHTVRPLVDFAFRGGRGTCFAYGQTGSGKTHTMSGIQELVAGDLFERLTRERGVELAASFFEIYGGRAFDVLHGRNPVLIREDEKHRVVASGLQDVVCRDAAALLSVIAQGNASRTTHSTEVNAGSSRSHAICELTLRAAGAAASRSRIIGSLTLIDLAGSERAADSRNHVQARRIESAEINTSLLALKECIRALAVRATASEETHVHVPFRASKLTLALRDSFESPHSRVVMIATVSPCAASWDHTGNTLRYAHRVKEQPSMDFDVEGKVIAGGPRVKGDAGPKQTYSFDAANALGSGAEPDIAAAGLPPRISPVTLEEGPAIASSGIVTGAKAPPMPVFRREKIAADRAEREKSAAAPRPAAVVPPLPSDFDVDGGGTDDESPPPSKAAAHGGSSGAAAPSSRGSLLSPPLRVPVNNRAAQQQHIQAPLPVPALDNSDRNTRRPATTTSSSRNIVTAASAAAARGGGGSLDDSLDEAGADELRGARGGGGDAATAAPQPPTGLAGLMKRAAIGKPTHAADASGERATKDVRAKLASRGRTAPPVSVAAAPQSRAAARGGGTVSAAASSREESFEEDSEMDTGRSISPSARARGLAAVMPALISSPQQRDIRSLHESMRRDAGARGGASAEDEEEEGGDDLLALHEAVGIIVDLEQELMDAHLKAIQVRRG